MKRAIVGVVTVILTGLAAVLAPAAPAQAAPSQLAISSAMLISWPHWPHLALRVQGTATCSLPTGQGEIDVIAVQYMEFVTLVGTATVPCGPSPVSWQVELYDPNLHSGWVNVSGFLADNGSFASDSELFQLG